MKKLLALTLVCFLILIVGCSKNETKSKVIKSEPATENTIVYITKTGECYHKEGCTSLRNSRKERTLSEVYKKYRPCSLCNPPTLEE
jgi:methylphosphotriester-DNA--protein-cysteine methyltransferase